MESIKNVTVIIPSLNPDEKLRGVVTSLLSLGFDDIVIVNDGSDEEHEKNFPSPEEFPAVTLLRHRVNKGKGAALKTAFSFIIVNRPETKTVSTERRTFLPAAEDLPKVTHWCWAFAIFLFLTCLLAVDLATKQRHLCSDSPAV